MDPSARVRLPVFRAFRRHLRTPRALTLTGLLVGLPLVGTAATSQEARYPYDPACPWGRLSNGKGMLHRCLSESEAVSLASAGSLADRSGARPAGTDAATEPEREPTTGDAAPPREFELVIGPIEADDGDITLGRLGVPVDNYKACIEEAGGLERSPAQVVVKFLVRGERLRAEGASVDSFEGVSEQAAKCIAFVVDRRQVGAPSVPLTGARLTFQFKGKSPLQK